MEVGTKSLVSAREGQTTARASRVSWLGFQAALLLLPSPLLAGEVSRAKEVVLRFLGNESFAIEAGGRTVLIDALQVLGAAEHGDLTDEVFAQMLARKRPFEKVPLVLVSHPHPDHHVPSVTARFLTSHPESTVVSSPEVLATMAGEAGYAGFRARLREVRPSPGASVALEHQGISVRFFELPHLAHELYQVRVVAHLVRHGGVSVLHVGDAELTAAHLAGLGLLAEKVDVAILPYWFFKQPDARALVDQHIGAKRIVAMRLPQGGLEEAQRAIAASFPEVVVLTRPMESLKL